MAKIDITNSLSGALSETTEKVGEAIDHVCKVIERENPDLDGVMTNTKYSDRRKYPDDKLRQLIFSGMLLIGIFCWTSAVIPSSCVIDVVCDGIRL